MSTVIYPAWRIKLNKLHHFLEFVSDYQMKQVIKRTVDLLETHREIWMGDISKAIVHYDGDVDTEITNWDGLYWIWMQAKNDEEKHPDKIFGFHLTCGWNIWTDTKYAYVKYFGPMSMEPDERKLPNYMESYFYFNHSDRPEEISSSQWRARKKKWDKLIQTEPTQHKRMRYHVMEIKDSFGIGGFGQFAYYANKFRPKIFKKAKGEWHDLDYIRWHRHVKLSEVK